MPTSQPFTFTPLLERVAAALPPDVQAYLVGGAVRDALLGRTTHDLDFILPGQAIRIARRLADDLGVAFYPLDEEHDTGRLLMIQADGSRFFLDFAARRGPDLESDLRARDFTVNAMAVDIRHPQKLLDPLGGAADLRIKQLRACSMNTFSSDPLRILRAIRQAAAYDFRIVPETRDLMRQAAPLLPNVSRERLRDELFRILDGPRAPTAIRALDLLGALPYILPELGALKGVEQTTPHAFDVWTHTLTVLQKLGEILEALQPNYDPEKAGNLALGLAVLRLGRFREPLGEHLRNSLNIDRPLRPLLYLAGLYHDVAKPQTRAVEADGRVRFLGHEDQGARIASARGVALHLSNIEVERLKLIVRHHLRPLLLAQNDEVPTRRAIYRFFRDTGAAGVDVCVLSMADFLGTYGAALPQATWAHYLEVIRSLLEAWWEHPEISVTPLKLVNGNDLIAALGIEPGPQVGKLLEAIYEAQAVGQIQTKDEAFALAKQLLAEQG